jgi:hypothetical protein
MSADLLREAAEVLRALSNGATDGPWAAGHECDGVLAERRTVVRADGKRVVTVGQTRPHHHGPEAEVNVAYIATMHPGVGLALADWLDTMAVIWGGGGKYVFGQPPSDDDQPLAKPDAPIDPTSLMGRALTLARLILGRAS